MSDSMQTYDVRVSEDAEPLTQRVDNPGILVLFTGGRPAAIALPLAHGPLEIGRDRPFFSAQPDPRMSRRHASIRFDDAGFLVTDLGSRNGTTVDGEPMPPGARRRVRHVVRAGDTLLVPVLDIGPFERLGVHPSSETVAGPALQQALQAAEHAYRQGSSLHVVGETGAGKEHLVRAVHERFSKGAPFRVAEGASMPVGVAHATLFGQKTEAGFVEGHVQTARGGTLLLKEVADLSLTVQTKLVSLLDRGEVLPLRASHPRRVDLRVCFASRSDLREEVASRRLREDLYHSMSEHRVIVPPLRERPEEIPWLVAAHVARIAPGLPIHPTFLEACLLRVWPGNVRELLSETANAAQTAIVTGARRLESRHLGAGAGMELRPTPSPDPPPKRPPPGIIAAALERYEGNISAASRALGVHRTQLRRWMERYHIDPRVFTPMSDDSVDAPV
jgi:transcriptional regulator of acetoin/glycerol metabolism